jgi:hypothetical protein
MDMSLGGGCDAPDSTSMDFKQAVCAELESGWAQALIYAVTSKSPQEAIEGMLG